MSGVYRLTAGSRLIESSYDYDTTMIGPFSSRIKLGKPSVAHSIEKYKLYSTLLSSPKYRAVFSDGRVLGVIATDSFEVIPLNKSKYAVVQTEYYALNNLVPERNYQHIGFERTECLCKDVFIPPFRLLLNPHNNYIMGYNKVIDCKPVINPSVNLYVDLVKTEHKAVYLDSATNQPVYLD